MEFIFIFISTFKKIKRKFGKIVLFLCDFGKCIAIRFFGWESERERWKDDFFYCYFIWVHKKGRKKDWEYEKNGVNLWSGKWISIKCLRIPMNSIKISKKKNIMEKTFPRNGNQKKKRWMLRKVRRHGGAKVFFISWEFAFYKKGSSMENSPLLFFFIVFVSVYYDFSASCWRETWARISSRIFPIVSKATNEFS